MESINSGQISTKYQLRGGGGCPLIPSSEEMGSSFNKLLWSAVAKFLYGIDVHGISLAAKTAICLNDKLLSVSVEWSPEESLLGIFHRQTPTLMSEDWGCTAFL